MIVHIAHAEQWEAAQETGGEYLPADFEEDGFIHCSFPDTVAEVANERFAGQDDLVLLWIDPPKVKAGVIYERLPGVEVGDLYPHIYGGLNADAVVGVSRLEAWKSGGFVLPPQPAT
mgnify:CR=1 FL=1